MGERDRQSIPLVEPAPSRPAGSEDASRKELFGGSRAGLQASLLLDGLKPSSGVRLDTSTFQPMRDRIHNGEPPFTTTITNGSKHERNEFWNGEKSEYKGKTFAEQKQFWIVETNKFLGKYKDKPEAAILKKLDISTDEGAAEMYEEYFGSGENGHKGDIGYFAHKAATNLTDEQLKDPKTLKFLEKIGGFYGKESGEVARHLAEGIKNVQDNVDTFTEKARKQFNEGDTMEGIEIINKVHERNEEWKKKREELESKPVTPRQPAAQPVYQRQTTEPSATRQPEEDDDYAERQKRETITIAKEVLKRYEDKLNNGNMDDFYHHAGRIAVALVPYDRNIALTVMNKLENIECYEPASLVAIELGDRAKAEQMRNILRQREIDNGVNKRKVKTMYTEERIADIFGYTRIPNQEDSRFPDSVSKGLIAASTGDTPEAMRILNLLKDQYNNADAGKLAAKLLKEMTSRATRPDTAEPQATSEPQQTKTPQEIATEIKAIEEVLRKKYGTEINLSEKEKDRIRNKKLTGEQFIRNYDIYYSSFKAQGLSDPDQITRKIRAMHEGIAISKSEGSGKLTVKRKRDKSGGYFELTDERIDGESTLAGQEAGKTPQEIGAEIKEVEKELSRKYGIAIRLTPAQKEIFTTKEDFLLAFHFSWSDAEDEEGITDPHARLQYVYENI